MRAAEEVAHRLCQLPLSVVVLLQQLADLLTTHHTNVTSQLSPTTHQDTSCGTHHHGFGRERQQAHLLVETLDLVLMGACVGSHLLIRPTQSGVSTIMVATITSAGLMRERD